MGPHFFSEDHRIRICGVVCPARFYFPLRLYCRGFPFQGLRANKFATLRTLSEIRVLADREIDNVRKKAKVIAVGVAGGKGDSGTKRKGSMLAAGGKKPRGALPEDEDVEHREKNSINVPFVLWGFSQKKQVAGVRRLVVYA
jgi:hypothetical protein